MSSCIWLTGPPASGKTTLSRGLHRILCSVGTIPIILDGDEVRKTLCADLGFSSSDRLENTRRVASTADLLQKQGFTVLVALITPERQMQNLVKAVLPSCLLVYCKAPLAILERRDPKGHYREARAGLRQGFTGVHAPYIAPNRPDIVLDTSGAVSIHSCIDTILNEIVIYKPADLP